MLEFLKIRNGKLIGGDKEHCCEVKDGSRTVAWVYYRQPTSDEKLEYLWEMKNCLVSEDHLREIKEAKFKSAKCHQLIVRDIAIPFGKKIFKRSHGYIDAKDMRDIDIKPPCEQFDFIAKWHSNHIVDMTAFAYEIEGIVKKKY